MLHLSASALEQYRSRFIAEWTTLAKNGVHDQALLKEIDQVVHESCDVLFPIGERMKAATAQKVFDMGIALLKLNLRRNNR